MSTPKDWAIFIYDGTVETDNAGGGTVNVFVTGTAGSVFEILYGMIENQEGASARNTKILIQHGADLDLPLLVDASQAAGTERAFPIADPEADGSSISAGATLILAGAMRVSFTGTSFAQGAKLRAVIVCRVWGVEPAVTVSVSAGAATETVAKELVL